MCFQKFCKYWWMRRFLLFRLYLRDEFYSVQCSIVSVAAAYPRFYSTAYELTACVAQLFIRKEARQQQKKTTTNFDIYKSKCNNLGTWFTLNDLIYVFVFYISDLMYGFMLSSIRLIMLAMCLLRLGNSDFALCLFPFLEFTSLPHNIIIFGIVFVLISMCHS